MSKSLSLQEKMEKYAEWRVVRFVQYLCDNNRDLIKENFRVYCSPLYENDINKFCSSKNTIIMPLFYYYRLRDVHHTMILIMDEKRKTLKDYLPKYNLDGFPVVFMNKKWIARMREISTNQNTNVMYMYMQDGPEIRDAIMVNSNIPRTKEELDEICESSLNPYKFMRYTKIYESIPTDISKNLDWNVVQGMDRLQMIQNEVYEQYRTEKMIQEAESSKAFNEEESNKLIERLKFIKPTRTKKERDNKEEYKKKLILRNKNGNCVKINILKLYQFDPSLIKACLKLGYKIDDKILKDIENTEKELEKLY